MHPPKDFAPDPYVVIGPGHSLHSVWASMSWYVPKGQTTHVRVVVCLYVPEGQGAETSKYDNMESVKLISQINQ